MNNFKGYIRDVQFWKTECKIHLNTLICINFLRSIFIFSNSNMGFPGGSVVKNLPADAGDVGPVPGVGRPLGEANGSPLQYSCLGNSMDKGAWQATVYRVTKSRTWLKRMSIVCSTDARKEIQARFYREPAAARGSKNKQEFPLLVSLLLGGGKGEHVPYMG